jgi:hypothetical protein
LLVDDQPDIHEVTQISLSNFSFAGRSLEFLNAYTADDDKKIFQQESDIAVTLVDAVMENEHARLGLIRFIRGDLRNEFTRLILRTGQPGQASERDVIREYDVNDYKKRPNLPRKKNCSTTYTSLRSYRDLVALD